MQRERVGDVVVVIPGIMGTALKREGVEVWNASPGAAWAALRSRLRSVASLRLPEGVGDRDPNDGVEPAGLMRTLHAIPGVWSPVVGYDGLIGWLRREFTLELWDPQQPERPANLVAFGYDWRLSNRLNGRRLADFIAPILRRWRQVNPDAQLILLCHSMGGLVARHFLEKCDGAADCRMLITLGTPYRGSLSALAHVVNGLPGGRLAAGLTALARSLPSLYQLSPDYACLTGPGGLLRPQEAALGFDKQATALLADAAGFHDDINTSVRRRGGTPYQVRAFQGFRQPTPTTATVTAQRRLVTFTSIDGEDEGGDGRVARLSGTPPEQSMAEPTGARPLDVGYSARHGALPDSRVLRELIWQTLTSRRCHHRGPEDGFAAADRLGVEAPDLVRAGEDCPVTVIAPPGADRLRVRARLVDPDASDGADRVGAGLAPTLANVGGGRYATVFKDLPAGLHVIEVRAAADARPLVHHVVVWGDEDE